MTLDALKTALAGQADLPAWQQQEREDALAHLLRDGFPTRRDETWKYTRADAFAEFAVNAVQAEKTTLNDAHMATAEALLTKLSAKYSLVFVNGQCVDRFRQLPKGVTATPRESAGGQALAGAEHAMVQLAAALPDSDLVIDIAADRVVKDTLHVIHVVTRDQLSQVRLSINAAVSSSLSIAEHFISASAAAPSMSNTVITASIAPSATLRLYRLQALGENALQATRIDATLAEKSVLEAFTLDAGAALVRNDFNVRLEGQHARVNMDGLYLTDKRQHVDNHTRADHVARDTESNEDYRGILRDHSRGVFNGKVVVHEGADGTNASQSNPNLLLSDHAEIDTKPELEIYADDVKCAHGATVGQLDDTSLFYLRSRGIDERTATQLLTYAFCRETLADIKDTALRAHLEHVIADQIPEFTALDIES